MAVQSKKENPRRKIILSLLLTGVFAFWSASAIAQAGNVYCRKISDLPGQPLQMQWNFLEQTMLITIENGDSTLHSVFRVQDDTSFSTLFFSDKPRFVAPHPTAKAWAGALPDGKPWSSGNYRFLSRFGERKIFLRHPNFNITGNLLAFSAYTPYDKNWRLMTYDLKYDNLNEMQGLPSGISYPVWSPKGTYIAFVLPSEHLARKQAGLVRWDGTGLRLISSESMSYEFISWPGSEQYVILTARDTEKWYVIRMLISKGEEEKLYCSETPLKFAQWIPQSGKIAFLKQNHQQWELWLLDADGRDY